MATWDDVSRVCAALPEVAESIRREWALRQARGESTANLAAFSHLAPEADR